jgi:hypothetical protein
MRRGRVRDDVKQVFNLGVGIGMLANPSGDVQDISCSQCDFSRCSPVI